MLPQNIIVIPLLDIYTHRLQIPFPLNSVFEIGVGAQLVGGGPEVVFELFDLAAIHRYIRVKVC